MTEFCVENAQQFDCPEVIYFEAGEGCTWAFEIGSFQEGENVVWNFGDGQESVEGGHFHVHDFPNTGTYEVTAFFTSSGCHSSSRDGAADAASSASGRGCESGSKGGGALNFARRPASKACGRETDLCSELTGVPSLSGQTFVLS